MEEPLVSIISPTFNHGRFIGDCIESVLNQSYKNWEMIIVSDGSTDDTLEIAQSYELKHDNIHVFHQQNIGAFRLAETYNFALEKSKGKYIAILEGDDYWSPEKLTLQVRELESNEDAVLCWCGAVSVDAFTKETLSTHPSKAFESKQFTNEPVGTILKTLYYNNCIPALTILLKRTTLVEIGGFIGREQLPLIDYPTILEFSLKGRFLYVDEVLGAWRIYPSQVTKRFTAEINEGLYSYMSEHYLRNKEELDKLIDWKAVENHHRIIRIMSYSRGGRYALIRKEFKHARKQYVKSLKLKGGWSKQVIVWKIRSIIGIICGFFHLDVEWMAKLLNKPSYK